MTKDELEKEAEENSKIVYGYINDAYVLGHIESAEPREKRIAELEATNKRISNECHTLVDTLEKKQKEVAELEKENELLKTDLEFTAKTSNENKQTVKEYSKLVDEYSSEGAELEQKLETERNSRIALVGKVAELETRCAELFLQNNEFAERFAKSIEIIKGLLPCCRNYPQENAEKMKQAEQFLRENDIDNAIQEASEGLNLDKIADEVKQDLNESCPDIFCKDCNKEDCIVRKLGLIC